MAKIYQLYYTRLGKQGTNAGWQVAATSAGTPQLVKNAFYKLASNLVATGTGTRVPSLAFDLQILENYVFLSHVNYHSVNEGAETDSRGVSFVHGFAVRVEDYRKLCQEPEQLLGLDDSEIVMNYSGQKELPLLEAVAYRPMDQETLLGKYHLDQERYENLMNCFYAALGTVGGTLVVKCSETQGEALRTLFQEITCLIMRSLPYILRLKITAFSGIRQGALLCFAEEKPERGIWFDLDDGSFHCPQVPEYAFIRKLNDLSLTADERKELYEALEKFSEITYGGNYEILKLNHMELAYHAVCRCVSEDDLDAHMAEAASLRAFKYDLLDEYYAYLVGRYVQNGRDFPSPDVLKKMQKRYVDTENPALKTAFADYYAEKVCLPGEVSAYDMLYRMAAAKPQDYQYLFEKLEQIRPEFLQAYYVDYYLAHEVTDLEKLETMCREHPDQLEGASGEKLLEIMNGFFQQEFAEAGSNEQRHQICRKYAGLCRFFPESMHSQTDACCAMYRKAYWEQFSLREFRYANQKEYYDMGAGETQDAVVPQQVSQLLEAREAFIQGPDIWNFQNVFFSGKIIADEAMRKQLVRELHEEAKEVSGLPLDAYLLLNYSGANGFDLNGLSVDLKKRGNLDPECMELKTELEHSQFVKPGSDREEQFKTQLKELAKDKHSDELLRALYHYYFPQMSGSKTRFYRLDFAQKCLLFLAVTLTYVVLVKYLMGEQVLYGQVAAGIGAVASIGGFILNLLLGETNSLRLFVNGDSAALISIITLAVVSVILVAAAIFVSAVWIAIVLAVVVVILAVGRLILLFRNI